MSFLDWLIPRRNHRKDVEVEIERKIEVEAGKLNEAVENLNSALADIDKQREATGGLLVLIDDALVVIGRRKK